VEFTYKTVAALAIVSFLGGLVAAASAGYGPLAAISFNVLPANGNATTTSPPSDFYTEPFVLDLGNITAGEAGSFNGTAVIAVPYPTYVEFSLDNKKVLRSVFDMFLVWVTVNNETFVLDIYGPDDWYVFLPAGEHQVYITVDYLVKIDASGSYSDVVFLKAEIEDDSSSTSSSFTSTSTFDYDDDDDYDDEEDDD